MNKKRALYLIEEAFDEGSPVMVHGTCVEATIKLLSEGKLPTSFYVNRNSHPAYSGYLFFVPRKKYFVGHPLYDKVKIDWDGRKLEDGVAIYAGLVQRRIFLNDLLGHWPEGADFEDLLIGNQTFEELEEMGVDVIKMKQYGIGRFEKEIKQRKGVVIGINEKIFELKIEDGIDEPGEEVMIHLPKGLDIKYIHYIYPFGELEEKALYDFIQTLSD